MMTITPDHLHRAAELIRTLAASEPIYDTPMGGVGCNFCWGDHLDAEGRFVHEETCPIVEARQLVRECPDIGGKMGDSWRKSPTHTATDDV